MSQRTVVISDEQLPEPMEFLRTEVYYSEGGANYFSGDTNARGYYVAVRPIKKENGCVSFMLFTGSKSLVQEAKRFSAKTSGLQLAMMRREASPMAFKSTSPELIFLKSRAMPSTS